MLSEFSYKNNKASGEIAICSNIEINNNNKKALSSTGIRKQKHTCTLYSEYIA